LLAIPYLEYAYGAYYVAGGLYQLVYALVSLLEARGAELRVRAKAVRIHTTEGRAAAVELADGQQLEADVVVFNGDAACLPQLLNCAIAPRRETPRSLSAFVLLLGLKRKLDGQHHHTVYFSPDYDQEFTELFGTDGQLPRFPVEPTVYVNAPSRSDVALAPANGETLFIMANAPALGSQWDATTTQTARKRVLAKLAAGGLSISSADIAVESIWTPSRIEDQYSMPGGAIYGQASHGWRGAFIRPANRDRRIRGLYLVGGSSHPGGGTPTVLLSARIVEKLVNRYDSA